MLTCMTCTKQLNGGSLHQKEDNEDIASTPMKKPAVKTLTTQIKGMALKASGVYKNCKPCSSGGRDEGGYERYESGHSGLSKRFNFGYERANSAIAQPRLVVHRLEMGLSSGESIPASVSGRREALVFTEEDEPKEWVAQVEPGVLINFVSMPQGGNELKRIRFSRELFNKWQAQRWWAENYDKVMELYNVQRYNKTTVPLPTPPSSDNENSKFGSVGCGSPATPPLGKESLPRNFPRAAGIIYSSSDSLDHHGLTSTPKLSNISATKTETSSIDASARSSFSRTDELSVSNTSDIETEWVEQDEPGVYITIKALPDGTRELRRVRFSRERFGEMHARMWWEANKARIQQQYL